MICTIICHSFKEFSFVKWENDAFSKYFRISGTPFIFVRLQSVTIDYSMILHQWQCFKSQRVLFPLVSSTSCYFVFSLPNFFQSFQFEVLQLIFLIILLSNWMIRFSFVLRRQPFCDDCKIKFKLEVNSISQSHLQNTFYSISMILVYWGFC